ncbi:MAG: Mut7-C RNAse domain-containing protein [Thermoplasmata archaeon]
MIIADSMLGKLTTYLRMLGYEVEYVSSDKEDSFVADESREKILLTRDKALHRKTPNSILVKAYDPKEQLREVIPKLPEPEHGFLELCSLCGAKIQEVRNRENLPEYVNVKAEKIYYCSRCNKYYWEGSHTDNFRKMLRGLGIEIR